MCIRVSDCSCNCRIFVQLAKTKCFKSTHIIQQAHRGPPSVTEFLANFQVQQFFLCRAKEITDKMVQLRAPNDSEDLVSPDETLDHKVNNAAMNWIHVTLMWTLAGNRL